MPPYFAATNYHLSRLPLSTRIALTGFCTIILTAILFVGLVLFGERTGWEVKKTQLNFQGTEKYYGEMPKQPPKEGYFAGKSEREIYDIIHPHSFMMPIIFFILCHLTEMTLLSAGFRIGAYLLSCISMIIVIFTPWLVTRNKELAYIVVPSIAVMLVAFVLMTVNAIVNAWFIRR